MKVLAKNQDYEEVEMHLQMDQNSQWYYVKNILTFVTSVLFFNMPISFGLIFRQPRQGKSGVEVDTDCKVTLITLNLEWVVGEYMLQHSTGEI